MSEEAELIADDIELRTAGSPGGAQRAGGPFAEGEPKSDHAKRKGTVSEHRREGERILNALRLLEPRSRAELSTFPPYVLPPLRSMVVARRGRYRRFGRGFDPAPRKARVS